MIIRVAAPVLLVFLCLVTLAVSGVQAQVLDYIVEVNQAGAQFTVRANNATTEHWMGGEGFRSAEASDVLTVDSGSSSWDDPPDHKPHKPYGIWPSLDTLVEWVSWLPLYAQEMVVGYRLVLSLQEDSLSVRGYSWWPVVAVVVLGELSHTWWHSESPLFSLWEEQQQHRASGLKILTCPGDRKSGQCTVPQGEGAGVSVQWTGGGSSGGGTRFRVHGGHPLSGGGGGGGHHPQDGHTRSWHFCPECCHQPCQYFVKSSPYGEQFDPLMNGDPVFSNYPPEQGLPINYGVGKLPGHQGNNLIGESASEGAGRVPAQQQPVLHELVLLGEEGEPPPLEDDVLSGFELADVSLMECMQTSDDQGVNGMAGVTCSVLGSDYSSETESVIVSSETSDQPDSDSFCESPGQVMVYPEQVHEKKPFLCPHEGCDKAYKGKGRLTYHIHQVHSTEAEKVYKCSRKNCDQAFFYEWHLRIHQRQHRREVHKTTEEFYKCSLKGCSEKYKYSAHLTMHLAQAHGIGRDKLRPCRHEGCGKMFMSSQSLERHQTQMHTPDAKKTVFCPHDGCSKSFLFQWEVKHHVRRMHTPKKDQPCKCPNEGCNEAYAYPSRLEAHLKSCHSKAKKKRRSLKGASRRSRAPMN